MTRTFFLALIASAVITSPTLPGPSCSKCCRKVDRFLLECGAIPMEPTSEVLLDNAREIRDLSDRNAAADEELAASVNERLERLKQKDGIREEKDRHNKFMAELSALRSNLRRATAQKNYQGGLSYNAAHQYHRASLAFLLAKKYGLEPHECATVDERLAYYKHRGVVIGDPADNPSDDTLAERLGLYANRQAEETGHMLYEYGLMLYKTNAYRDARHVLLNALTYPLDPREYAEIQKKLKRYKKIKKKIIKTESISQ